jgi:hypothetical protein
VQSLHSANK